MKRLLLIFTILLSLLLFFVSCTSNYKEKSTQGKEEEKQRFESDSAFLDYIQKVHFNYMWNGAEENSGLAKERIHINGNYPLNDEHIITTGGSGFGILGILVGIKRGFITRKQGVERFEKIVSFLEKTKRFKGMWAHWIDGRTGKVKPFGNKDDGGDIVESSFLIQGLLCVRQYIKDGNTQEKALANRIDTLWKEMNWTWYMNNKDVLYWHWSPNAKWQMDMPIKGYNESLIAYILAASSPTYTIPATAYHKGWAKNGTIKSTQKAYNLPLLLKYNGAKNYGGPLFWAHYSYLALNPKGLSDRYADYWELNKNQTLINYQYCVENPKKYKGYGKNCWGLTASYSVNGYSAHKPMKNDKGVITPTAALSSFPYTPQKSMEALKHFYFDLGDKIWGKYGFYDAFSEQYNWYPKRYLAIDQLTITPMIENYRSHFIWDLFMSCPEIQKGLDKLGFTYKKNNKI